MVGSNTLPDYFNINHKAFLNCRLQMVLASGLRLAIEEPKDQLLESMDCRKLLAERNALLYKQEV